jgi:hypothetical protein
MASFASAQRLVGSLRPDTFASTRRLRAPLPAVADSHARSEMNVCHFSTELRRALGFVGSIKKDLNQTIRFSWLDKSPKIRLAVSRNLSDEWDER